jgi:hypothetical protein
MANWWENVKRVEYSKGGRRFLSSFDMSEAKRLDSILNSRIKRGEIPAKFNRYMCDCGCGCTGCIIVNEYGNIIEL